MIRNPPPDIGPAVPPALVRQFQHIMFLRNFFQDPDLMDDKYVAIERELAAALPPLEGGGVLPLEEYAPGELSLGEISELFKTGIRPVVLRGLAADLPCVKEWTPENFRKRYGDFRIFFTSTENIVEDQDVRLAEFVDAVLAADKSRRYIENLSGIFNEYPELHDQLGLDRVARHFEGFATYHKIAQLFFGGYGTGAAFHCANELNVFLNIYGRKQWTFLHPRYGFAMYPTLMNRGYFVGSFVKHNAPAGFIEANTPLYNRVPKLMVTLDPGDVLVNPPWWWHAVKNVTPSTIAVATRWGMAQDYPNETDLFDFVQSMRVDTWVAFDKDYLNTVVVVPDEKIRKNYVSYDEMGWRAR